MSEHSLATGPDAAALSSRVDGTGGANVLLVAPGDGHDEDAACIDLLTERDPAAEDVIWVSHDETPDGLMDRWDRHGPATRPAAVDVVKVNGTTRSAASASSSVPVPWGELAIHTVPDPADVGVLGGLLSDRLDARADDGRRTVLCFDSVPALLDAAGRERAFQFLHLLTLCARSADAVAHYHFDPDACEDGTANTLAPLFDAVVKRAADGTWTVSGTD